LKLSAGGHLVDEGSLKIGRAAVPLTASEGTLDATFPYPSKGDLPAMTRIRLFRRFALVGTALLGAAVLAAGCGSSDDKGRFHRLQTPSHLIERAGEGGELAAQIGRGHPDRVLTAGDVGGRGGNRGHRLGDPTGQIGARRNGGGKRGDQRYTEGHRTGGSVGLFDMIGGVGRHRAGPAHVFVEDRRTRQSGDQPDGHYAGRHDQDLGEEQVTRQTRESAAHPHSPIR
jgi:hypothetical protein